ncbi:MAG: hypothetical protein AAFX99_05465, partial [Myxococcota bacterium]
MVNEDTTVDECNVEISGRVTDFRLSQQPLSGIRISVEPAAGAITTDSNGVYAIDVDACERDTYTLRTSA